MPLHPTYEIPYIFYNNVTLTTLGYERQYFLISVKLSDVSLCIRLRIVEFILLIYDYSLLMEDSIA